MRQSILGMVKANFPSTRIVDEMKAARGVPDRDVWLGGIDFSLRQLAGLRSGEVDLSRDGLSVAGEAASPAAYKTIKGEIRSNLPKGIRLAEDKVSPPRVSPFTWKAELSPSQLVMSGHVLGDKVRERVFARAKELFAKLAVVDRMETADGAGEEWPGVALAALDLLAQLQDGSASIVDRSLVLAGRAADEATAERVRTELRRAAPSSYSVSERLTYPKPEPKPVSPFVTGISGAADKIELTGYVPSEAARANVLARIASRFPKASISDQMKVAAGAPEGWKECLEAGLGGLQQLGAATIALSDRRLELVGRTEREGLAENVAGEVKAAANRACETDVRIAYDAEPEPSLVWRAVHGGDGTLVLEGEVPDQETHAELVTTAGKAFSGARLTDNAKIVGVRPGKWPKAAGLGLRLLAKLRRGTAAISGAELTIVGEAKDAAIAQSVKDQLGREIAKGYRGVDNIEVRSDAMIWAEQEAQRRAEAQRLKEQAEQQRQRDEAGGRPSGIPGPGGRGRGALVVHVVVYVEFAGQQIGLVAGRHHRGDRQDARLGRLGKHDLVLVVAALLCLERGAADLELDPSVSHRAVVGEAIEVERDPFAVEHTDEFEDVGLGSEARQRLADGRGRSVTVVMAFASR